uniref:Uncharacterized protein n=1 Tax=Cannabis sativa TaxID=3483 RepID=A0A803NS58_CANSA
MHQEPGKRGRKNWRYPPVDLRQKINEKHGDLRDHPDKKKHALAASAGMLNEGILVELAILRKDIARVSRRRKGDDSNSNCEDREPCTWHILDAELPKNFKMPEMVAYTGDSDPSDHLSRFNWVMTVMRVSNDVKCLCLPLTLSGSAEE